MPTLGNPIYNWDAPCQEQELIRWKSVVEDNFKINKTANDDKAAFIRGWIGDTGVQKLRKFEWTGTEWDEYDKVMMRFKLVIQPTNRNQSNRYALELNNYRQTTETFIEFWTELKRRFTLARDSFSRMCEDHKDCAGCKQRYWEVELMSKIYIGVRDQRIRELIDQLPEEQHKLTRYVEIGECYEASLASAQTFSTMATTTISAVRRQTDNKGQFKCQRCGKHHNKGECKALKVKCHKCDRVGHFAKMCKSRTQGKQTNNKIHRVKPRTLKSTNVHLVSDEGQNLGTTDWETANKLFDGVAWTDSIDIFPDISDTINYQSKDVQVDNVCQKQKSQAFTFVNMYPTSLQGKNTGPAKQVKCKIDSGAGANLMSLDDYKKVNPSEFDEAGNSLAGFSNDKTTLKAYGGKTIQQYGVRVINCQWNNKCIRPIFHIVEAKGPILLGLTTLRKMGLFHKHPRVFIESMDIHPM